MPACKVIELQGAKQRRFYRAATKPRPFPTGTTHEDWNDRRTILELVQRGVFCANEQRTEYWRNPDVKVRARMPLMDRLKKGPLASDDWADVASSRNAMTVRISQLRSAGHKIASRPSGRTVNNTPVVEYVLEK